jgi:hypothetical protein
MIVHHINVAPSENKKIRKDRSKKYRKIMQASTQITHPFAEVENKTLLLFVNVKQKQVKIIGFSVFNISSFP